MYRSCPACWELQGKSNYHVRQVVEIESSSQAENLGISSNSYVYLF